MLENASVWLRFRDERRYTQLVSHPQAGRWGLKLQENYFQFSFDWCKGCYFCYIKCCVLKLLFPLNPVEDSPFYSCLLLEYILTSHFNIYLTAQHCTETFMFMSYNLFWYILIFYFCHLIRYNFFFAWSKMLCFNFSLFLWCADLFSDVLCTYVKLFKWTCCQNVLYKYSCLALLLLIIVIELTDFFFLS